MIVRSGLVYQPGTAFLCLGDRGGCFTSDRELATDLWPALSGESDMEVWDVALASGPTGLADLVLFEFDGDITRILVRGQQVSVISDDEKVGRTIDGRGVRTWVEQAVPRASVIAVGDLTLSPLPGLPLGAGIVHAEAFCWRGHQSDTAMSVVKAPDEPPRTIGPAQAPPVLARQEPARKDEQSAAAATVADIDSPSDPSASTPVAHQAPEQVSEPIPAPVPAPDPPTPGRTSFETRVGPLDEGYDHLFGPTILRSVEDAAVRPAPEEASGMISRVPGISSSAVSSDLPAAPMISNSPGPPSRGDHDGSTILSGQIAVLRAAAESRRPAVPTRRLELVLSTGAAVLIDRPIIIGRLPQADRVTDGALPHLVTVPSPDGGISRSHVRIAFDGDQLIAEDLFSTNGSLIRRADGRVEDLAGGGSLVLDVGDVLQFGDDLTADVRQLS